LSDYEVGLIRMFQNQNKIKKSVPYLATVCSRGTTSGEMLGVSGKARNAFKWKVENVRKVGKWRRSKSYEGLQCRNETANPSVKMTNRRLPKQVLPGRL
jgi:hypothetical protein